MEMFETETKLLDCLNPIKRLRSEVTCLYSCELGYMCIRLAVCACYRFYRNKHMVKIHISFSLSSSGIIPLKCFDVNETRAG